MLEIVDNRSNNYNFRCIDLLDVFELDGKTYLKVDIDRAVCLGNTETTFAHVAKISDSRTVKKINSSIKITLYN